MIKLILEVVIDIVALVVFAYLVKLVLNTIVSILNSIMPYAGDKKKLKKWLKHDMKHFIEDCDEGTEVVNISFEELSNNQSKAWYELKQNGGKDKAQLCVLINNLEPYKAVYYGPDGIESIDL